MSEFLVQIRWYLDIHSNLRLDEIDELIANRSNEPHDWRPRRLITDEPLTFEQLMEANV